MGKRTLARQFSLAAEKQVCGFVFGNADQRRDQTPLVPALRYLLEDDIPCCEEKAADEERPFLHHLFYSLSTQVRPNHSKPVF